MYQDRISSGAFMSKILLILVVLMHGIGHVLFLVPLFTNNNWGQSTQSWLVGSDTLAKIVGSIIWIAAIIAFLGVTYGMVSEQAWWRTTAIGASLISAIGIVLFWRNPVSSSAIFALITDIAIIIALVALHWPSDEMIGV